MPVASVGSLSPDQSSAPSIARSSATFGPRRGEYAPRRRSSSSDRGKVVDAATVVNTKTNTTKSGSGAAQPVVPDVSVNGAPLRTPRPPKSPAAGEAAEEGGWGSNFWVTLLDPQTGTSFFACPATGQVSWDAPVGNFVLPPNDEGEWWELSDESRGGLPYYYQTKTAETVWERPEGFVIPLGIIQNTSLGRRLSRTAFHRNSIIASDNRISVVYEVPEKEKGKEKENHTSIYAQSARRSRSFDRPPPTAYSSTTTLQPAPMRRSHTDPFNQNAARNTSSASSAPSSSRSGHGHGHVPPIQLPPIPGSPYATDAAASPPDTPTSQQSSSSSGRGSKGRANGNRSRESLQKTATATTPPRSRAKSQRSPPQQSLGAAMEMFAQADASASPDSMGARRSISEGPSPTSQMGFVPDVPRLNLNLNLNLSGAAGNGNGNGNVRPGARHTPSPITPTRTSSNNSSGRDPFSRPPPSPSRPVPAVPGSTNDSTNGSINGHGSIRTARSVSGKEISGPVVNPEAAYSMSPVQNRAQGQPIPVEVRAKPKPKPAPARGGSVTLASGYVPPPSPHFWRNTQRKLSLSIRLSSKRAPSASAPLPSSPLARGPDPDASRTTYPLLPDDLASDIQQFSESQYARTYFSTHRTGFIFRRTVPVEQMMTWQKGPLNSPLLTLNRPLKVDAVRIFKVIQRIMGDREREEGSGGSGRPGRGGPNGVPGTPSSSGNAWLLEEERWLLGEGVSHGELRDEIYCQLMKQLTSNPSQDSVFKGWQMLCVLLVTFPASKNFETYLRGFIQQHTTHPEGRVDVMAKHCLKRLEAIAMKGPRGKPPSIAEIETASDAAFNPSTFGESLDAIIRLQERNYPHQKVPIILPFLADGMLALGGTKSEGIFRVPGDGDSISELKLRIDRGYYTLDDIDDPNILASLMKLWLRELCEPLVPEEMYNDCITNSKDPAACIQMVQRLPTINRRVVLFVISFLQLFLKDEIQAVTKMTPANLSLVMAPNLLRCNSDSMSIVFTNAQYEQIFVYNLLLHLKCNEIDPDYTPTHGLQNSNIGTARPRASSNRIRR